MNQPTSPPPSPSSIEHHYAGVFLVTPDQNVIGQLRDDKPGIDHPNRISSFGGTIEAGEDPLTAAWRELVQEETNLSLNKDDLKPYATPILWREMTGEWEVQHLFYALITEEMLQNMEVYEGQGWAIIDPDDLDSVVPASRTVFANFLRQVRDGGIK